MQEFTVKRLRAGQGVRDQGLRVIRGTELGRRLGVGADDDPMTVLVKVTWQVEHVIDEMWGDERTRRVLRYSFNTPRVHALNRLATQKERLELLALEGGPGKSTSDRLVRERSDEIGARWAHCEPRAIPESELELWLRREERHARTVGGADDMAADADDFERRMRDYMTGDRKGVERDLLIRNFHLDLVDGVVPSVCTAGGAQYVSVFTRPGFLAEYRRTMGMRPGREITVTGSEVLRRLRAAPGVGLAVNPFADGPGKSYWTPGEVASLLRRES